MEARAGAIRQGTAGELVWLVEHPPLYTAGTSAEPSDLIEPTAARLPDGSRRRIHYHGTASARGLRDARPQAPPRGRTRLRRRLERWIITTLAAFNVKGERRENPGRRLGRAAGPPRPSPTAARQKTRSPRSA